MMRIIRATVALCLAFAVCPALADTSCVSDAFIRERTAAAEMPLHLMTVKDNPGEIARAIEFYNSQPGDTVSEVDSLFVIDLPDGGFYMAFVAGGQSCYGARVRANAAMSVRRAIFGTAL